jgi:hypothetical protein
MQLIMRRISPACIALLSLLAGGGVVVRDAGAPDPLQVDPGHHRMEFENPHLRVHRGFFDPGESSADFFDAEGVVSVALTPLRMRLHLPDGGSQYSVRNRGEVVNVLASEHAPENLLDEPVEVIVVERK